MLSRMGNQDFLIRQPQRKVVLKAFYRPQTSNASRRNPQYRISWQGQPAAHAAQASANRKSQDLPESWAAGAQEREAWPSPHWSTQ